MAVRILIADDHDLVRGAIAGLLKKADETWEIFDVADGKAAIEKAAEVKPDVVILDVMMPVRDGISAGREIRSMFPTVPVVLYTSHASGSFEAEAQRAGFHAVVHKDNAAGLIAAVQSALAMRGFASGRPSSRPRRIPPSS